MAARCAAGRRTRARSEDLTVNRYLAHGDCLFQIRDVVKRKRQRCILLEDCASGDVGWWDEVSVIGEGMLVIEPSKA